MVEVGEDAYEPARVLCRLSVWQHAVGRCGGADDHDVPRERQTRVKWSQKSDPAAMRVRGRNPADDESPGMEQGSRATGDSCSV